LSKRLIQLDVCWILLDDTPTSNTILDIQSYASQLHTLYIDQSNNITLHVHVLIF